MDRSFNIDGSYVASLSVGRKKNAAFSGRLTLAHKQTFLEIFPCSWEPIWVQKPLQTALAVCDTERQLQAQRCPPSVWTMTRMTRGDRQDATTMQFQAIVRMFQAKL